MKTISLRLPEVMLNRIKVPANERDVPYQSLMKLFLRERIDREYELKLRLLSTLPHCIADSRGMTRSHDGRLDLSCKVLSFFTLHRFFIGAFTTDNRSGFPCRKTS
jgi:hypothetical protein